MRNIEERVYRQRFIIESHYNKKVTKEMVGDFLLKLASKLDMHVHPDLPKPIVTSATGKSKKLHDGYEGVLFWLESGCVLYVWEKLNFLTLDIYSCKKFDDKKALKFAAEFFGLEDPSFNRVLYSSE